MARYVGFLCFPLHHRILGTAQFEETEDSYAGALRDHVERFELRKRVAVDATSTWDPKVVSPVEHVEIDGEPVKIASFAGLEQAAS